MSSFVHNAKKIAIIMHSVFITQTNYVDTIAPLAFKIPVEVTLKFSETKNRRINDKSMTKGYGELYKNVEANF